VRRSLCLTLLATLFVLVPAPASAGGNWLEFREDPRAGAAEHGSGADDGSLGTWAVMHVGQQVVTATSVYATKPVRRHLEEEGPFYAWLVPEGSFGGRTRLPESAIRLAPFEIRWSSRRSASVRAHLTIPSVASGKYEVIVCNEPCTFPGFGEYVQGWATVMQTPDEAHLLAVARERKWKSRELAQRVNRLQREMSDLVADVAAAGDEQHEDMLRSRAAETRRFGTGGDRALGTDRRPLIPAWAAGMLAAAVVVAAVTMRRRRPDRFAIPDTVPDHLIEAERESTRVR
jgi:hypothetical protein